MQRAFRKTSSEIPGSLPSPVCDALCARDAKHPGGKKSGIEFLRRIKRCSILLSFLGFARPRSLQSVKTLTRDQLQRRKQKAERFVRDVLEDDERAEEIANESLEDYADRRKIRIANPDGGNMPVRTLKNGGRRPVAHPQTATVQPATPQNPHEALLLRQQIDELERENETLQDRLDKVADLASAPDNKKAAEDLTEDDLKDKLNNILDVAAPGEVEDADEDEDEEDK